MKDIINIHIEELKLYSHKLAVKIQESGYIPDHILYVERAGLFIGYEIADYFSCSISGIYSSRSGGNLKAKFQFILKFLPKLITNFLREIEIKSSVHDIKKNRNVYVEGIFPPKEKKILLVDDAIDSGHSMMSISDYLTTKGYNTKNIKIAVLTTTHKQSVCKPDYSLFEKTICAGPWSYDSKEYKQCWELYSKLKKLL